MTYAPRVPPPRVSMRRIPPGDAGVAVTLGEMRTRAVEGARTPLLRGLAADILGAYPVTDGPARLRGWIAESIPYVEDPPGVEMLTAPELLAARALAGEPAGGDCDDVATLAAALGMAAGFPARFVVVSFGPWSYEHVWTEIMDRGRWVELDTTRPAQYAPGAGVYRQTETAPMYCNSCSTLNGRRSGLAGVSVTYSTPGGSTYQTTASQQAPYENDPWYINALEGIFGLAQKLGWDPGCDGVWGVGKPKTWREFLACKWQQNPGPCPGTPDPRRAALAAQRDPGNAAKLSAELAAGNKGWAPTAQQMTDPAGAILWTWAAMGGDDCVASRDPSGPGRMVAWVEAATPEWGAPTGGGTGPGSGSADVDAIYQAASLGGEDAGREILEYLASKAAGAIPPEWLAALDRGVAAFYANRVQTAGSAIAQKWAPLAIAGVAAYLIFKA